MKKYGREGYPQTHTCVLTRSCPPSCLHTSTERLPYFEAWNPSPLSYLHALAPAPSSRFQPRPLISSLHLTTFPFSREISSSPSRRSMPPPPSLSSPRPPSSSAAHQADVSSPLQTLVEDQAMLSVFWSEWRAAEHKFLCRAEGMSRGRKSTGF